MKYILILFLLSSCSSGVIYTGKKGRWVGGNYSHMKARAEYKARKADEKAQKEYYGKQ